MFGFSNYWNKSKYYDNSKKLVVGKMKDGTELGAVAIRFMLYCIRLNPNMYSFLVDDNS